MILLLSLTVYSAWTETFETQQFFPPDNWLVVNEDALDAVWYRTLCQGHSGQYASCLYYDTTYSGLSYTNRDYLITPRVLPQGSDTLVCFWYIATTAIPCSLDIMVSTASTPEMSSFTVLQTFLLTDLNWSERTVSLNAYNSVPVYVAFRARRVPLLHAIGLDDIMLPDTATQPQPCSGRLRTKGVPSQKYLQVWGSNYEMGFAHGYLIASEIMSIYINKWIGNTSYHSVTPSYYEYSYLPWYREKYYIPAKYQNEAQGIIDGIIAKGVSLYHPALGRNLIAEDILVLTGAGDEEDFGCSSISGWGESTVNDDTLQGGYVIARNVDGQVGLYTTVANVSFIIAYSPSDPNEQKFFNVSFAGVFGAFSCLNESGVGLCSNTGNHPDTNSIPLHSLLGSLLSSRLAIEAIDPDGNGVNDVFDIDSMKNHTEHVRSNEYHVYSPYDAAHPIPGAIIEMNHIADTMRFSTHNYIDPPIYSQWNLAVTNHDRLLYPPVYCGRYQRLADSLNADLHLNTQRAMTIANSVAVNYNYGTSQCTYHSMVLRPDIAVEHPDWPCVGVSYARCYRAAHTQAKVWYSWNELFDGVPGVTEVVQKPVKQQPLMATIVAGPLSLPKNHACKIFDITGREIHTLNPAPGIYFIEEDGANLTKVIKVK
jgi:hypothetical protein